ncbi:hypothetical protein OH77DRAFT_318695 [Trametes cingulata]|nr:hypothetical protein OH77DRAFT_318695 [Trametes cingulata]
MGRTLLDSGQVFAGHAGAPVSAFKPKNPTSTWKAAMRYRPATSTTNSSCPTICQTTTRLTANTCWNPSAHRSRTRARVLIGGSGRSMTPAIAPRVCRIQRARFPAAALWLQTPLVEVVAPSLPRHLGFSVPAPLSCYQGSQVDLVDSCL